MNNQRKIALSLLSLSIVVLLTFGELIKTFYEQDEWMALGLILVQGSGYIFFNAAGPLQVLLGQGRILSNMVAYILLGNSPFNATPLAIFGITFHIINTLLVFILAKNFLRKIIPSLLAAAFFAVNSVASGAVTWAGAAIGTLPATALIFLATLAFFQGIGSQKKSKLKKRIEIKWLLTSLILVYLSLHFKEISIYLLVLLPLMLIVYKGYSLKTLPKIYWVFALLFLLAVGQRLIEFKSTTAPVDLFLTGSNTNYYQTLATRAILYPLTSFSLIYIPSEHFLSFAKTITSLYYPFFPSESFNLIAQTAVLDLLAIVLSFLLFTVIYFVAKNTPRQNKLNMVFLLSFMLLSFLPYVLIGKSYAYLESRYYYLAAGPAGILFGYIFSRIAATTRAFNKSLSFLAFAPAILFLIVHAQALMGDIRNKVIISQERLSYFRQLSEIKPKLESNKNVFYITGDRNYYISEGNNVPFQQGMGYSLMVWYFQKGDIPGELIEDRFLWDLGSQGYRERDEIGFGYFWDKSELQKKIEESGLEQEKVTAFYYDSKEKKLIKTPVSLEN